MSLFKFAVVTTKLQHFSKPTQPYALLIIIIIHSHFHQGGSSCDKSSSIFLSSHMHCFCMYSLFLYTVFPELVKIRVSDENTMQI